jgi:signal transduction histidine kinase
MTIALGELTEQYSAALREYCAEGGEDALFRAYQLGRRAAGEGFSVLEMAAVHQKALMAVLVEMSAVDESTRVVRRASELFADCLAPFELTRRVYRVYQEQNSSVCDLNEEPGPRINAVRHDFQSTQSQHLARRRTPPLENELLSVMSHEMSAPVRSLHDSLSLLKGGRGGELNAQGQRMLDVAYRNCQRLLRLVDDLVDGQGNESGTLSFIRTRPRAAGSGSASS